MQITIRSEGVKNRFLSDGMFLMNILIICSEELKSAITPSFSGRIVLMFSWVLPCIWLASWPTAIILLFLLSIATIDGLSTTTLSL